MAVLQPSIPRDLCSVRRFGDKTGLLALKRHFNHVSITITDGHVGRDLELLDLVASEKQQQLGHALDELIGADRMAGKLGEQIVARNERFLGRAGEEVRREYVRMVLEETDLVILPQSMATVFTARNSRVAAAPRSRVGVSTCIGCSDFAAGPAHVPFWQRRREDGIHLLANVARLQGRVIAAAAVRDMIAEGDVVLNRIVQPDATR